MLFKEFLDAIGKQLADIHMPQRFSGCAVRNKKRAENNYLSTNLCGNHRVQSTYWDYDSQNPKGEHPAITVL